MFRLFRSDPSREVWVSAVCVAAAIAVGVYAARVKQSRYDKAEAFETICAQLDAQQTTPDNEALKEICNSSRNGVDTAKLNR